MSRGMLPHASCTATRLQGTGDIAEGEAMEKRPPCRGPTTIEGKLLRPAATLLNASMPKSLSLTATLDQRVEHLYAKLRRIGDPRLNPSDTKAAIRAALVRLVDPPAPAELTEME